MMPPLVLYGAGGHARVILDMAALSGLKPDWVVDDHPTKDSLDGFPVIASTDRRWQDLSQFRFVVAVGRNQVRSEIFARLLARGGEPETIIHPGAVIARGTELGPGSVVMAGVVVNPGTRVGANVILNTCCSVDHDGIIGDHSHLCPGVHLAGTVQIGRLTLLGTGVSVIPGRTIGSEVTVGAGSVVLRDLPDGCCAFGNPARVQRMRPPSSRR